MIVVESTIGQPVLLFVILGELESEWTVGRTLLVAFIALVRRLAFLASVAVENVDAVAVWVVSLGSLRD